MKHSNTLNSQNQYSVSVWEGVGITAATIGLIVFALIGLSLKTLRNASDPQRAKTIANSLIDGTIPGNLKYEFGLNFASLKIAIITGLPPGSDSINDDISPEVSLIVAKAHERQLEEQQESPISSIAALVSYYIARDIQVSASHTENKPFCGKVVPVTIQQGILVWSDKKPSVSSIRYDASVSLERSRFSIALLTTGQNAQKQAETIFNSLKCKY
ncbi:MAG: hypothetical protein PUP93_03230 [Rhizonema sp. NSF051]|nr:hypothetical protein [Rhizonema sp. NSF051]